MKYRQRKTSIALKRMIIGSLLISGLLISGCAHTDLKAPCPNFGNSCTQTPINHWDTN